PGRSSGRTRADPAPPLNLGERSASCLFSALHNNPASWAHDRQSGRQKPNINDCRIRINSLNGNQNSQCHRLGTKLEVVIAIAPHRVRAAHDPTMGQMAKPPLWGNANASSLAAAFCFWATRKRAGLSFMRTPKGQTRQ